jgi:GNAT superfamily N-acetyltransferase
MQLGVVCRDHVGQNVIRDLRQWRASDDWAARRLIDDEVLRFGSLGEADDWRAADRNNRLLLAVGYSAAELADVHTKWPAGQLTTGAGAESNPGAILVTGAKGAPWAVNARQPLPGVREALLRGHLASVGETRVLKRTDDLVAYFRLRYKVWSACGFIAADRDPRQSRLEIEFSDRNAIPLGFFTHGGDLIGCLRLVRNFGLERRHYVDLIREIVERVGDPILRNNFERPAMAINQPFDMLEYFPDFRGYYRDLIRKSRHDERSVTVGEVSRVIVDENWRSRRISEIMIYELIALARSEGVTKLLLSCREDLMHLYSNCGFRQVDGIRAISYGSIPVPSFVMELDL